MPQLEPSSDVITDLFNRIKDLEAEVKRLREKPYLTIPRYDWNFPPDDAIEGQIAIFDNTPEA